MIHELLKLLLIHFLLIGQLINRLIIAALRENILALMRFCCQIVRSSSQLSGVLSERKTRNSSNYVIFQPAESYRLRLVTQVTSQCLSGEEMRSLVVDVWPSLCSYSTTALSSWLLCVTVIAISKVFTRRNYWRKGRKLSCCIFISDP